MSSESNASEPRKKSLLRRVLLFLVVVALGAGAVAPLLNANRFQGEIHSALESALNRRVTIGKVHFNLFTGPGFTVDDVLIEEAPGMGIEPFAHVESLEARVRLASLWTGHLAFSKLRLVEPSVNFVKPDSGSWNVAPWLARAAVDTAVHSSLPDIEISDGRLNFKFGDTKSVFYVSDADLSIYPDYNGDLIIRFEGEPARTDHAAQGLGHLVARGVLRTRDRKEDQLSMSVQLERTAITELTRLFDVQDIGVRGYIASNLKLDGPLSRLNVSGDMRIEDIHRWDLMPNKSAGWTLNYTGLFNVPAQQIDIETHAADPQGSPVNGKFVASDYLSSPKWQASLNLHDLPASGLLETARHMGAPIPAGAILDTTLNGEIAYSRSDGVQGQLTLDKGSFKLPQGVATQFGVAPLSIHNNELRFGPAEIQFDDEHAGLLDASYALNTRSLSLGLQTRQLGVAETRALVSEWLGAGSMPLLEQCRQGAWKGSLAFERRDDGPGVWNGDLDLTATQMDLPGVAAPLRIASATVQLQPGQVQLTRLHGHVGVIAVDGDYRYFEVPGRPDRMRLNLGEAQLENIERLLLPTLNRKQGFLARALRLERTHLPDWLKLRQIDGSIEIKNLLVGDVSLGAVKARLLWNGAAVQLADLEFHRDAMEGKALVAVDLTGGVPLYKASGQFNNVEYRNGTLDLDGKLRSSGMGLDLALNARGEGTFSGSGITLAPDTEVEEITGEFHLDAASAGPRLLLSKVQLTQGQDVLRGQGSSQPDGHIVLDLVSGRKQIRMTGMLFPLHPVVEP
jgi:hypothetical protein